MTEHIFPVSKITHDNTPFLSPTITFTKCPKVGTIVFGYSMHFRGWSTKNPKNLLGKKNFTPKYSLKDKVVVVKKR